MTAPRAPFLLLSLLSPAKKLRVVRVPSLRRSGRHRGPGVTPSPPHGRSPQRNARPSRHTARGQGRGQGTGDAVSTRHARSTAQEGTTRSNLRWLWEGHAAAGSLPPLLCPVLKQPGREQVVWACCRNSTPWCSNALKLCKQHRADALSRSLNSRPGRPGSLFKFYVIAWVVASAGLVRAAHACLCTSHDRPS